MKNILAHRWFGGVLAAVVATSATLPAIAADGLAEADENGIVPYVWWKFDGDNTEYGTYATGVNVTGTYVLSQGGFALSKASGYGGSVKPSSEWGDWTLSVVAKTTSTDNGVIFALGNRNSSNKATTRGLALASGGTGKVTVSTFFAQDKHTDLVTADIENASSEYHAFAVTFAGESRTLTLFIDGEAKGIATIEGDTNPVEGHWQFGSIHGGTTDTGLSEQKNQSFDDVRFYRQALTTDEVATIADAFPVWNGARTLEADEEWILEKDETLATLTTAGGAKIDLNGHNLTVGSASPSSFGTDGANLFSITNSNDEALSTLICGVGNGTLGLNKTAILGGNLKYVITGSNQTHFRANNEKIDGAIVPNTHTGGTVFSNATAQIRFHYSFKDTFGTGPLVLLGGASLFMPSQNAAGGWNVYNDIQVPGKDTTAKISFDLGVTCNFFGALTGKGKLTVSYSSDSRKPTLHNSMDMTAFEGVLEWKSPSDRASNWRGGQPGVPNGTVSLDNAAVAIKPYRWSDAQQKDIEYKPGVIEYGNLITSTDDPEEQSGAKITDQISYTTTTLRVGGLGLDGTYSGAFTEETAHNARIALDKVGAGTWTLNGASLAHRGDTTVSDGRLNVDSAEGWGTSKITVKAGATLGGTGTIPTSVTVEEGGILAGSLDLAGGVTFSGTGAATILVDAADSEAGAITIPGTINASTLTIRLTGNLDMKGTYPVITAAAGSTGRPTVVADGEWKTGIWRTRWETNSDGTQTLTGYFAPRGFSLHFR